MEEGDDRVSGRGWWSWGLGLMELAAENGWRGMVGLAVRDGGVSGGKRGNGRQGMVELAARDG